MTCKALAVVGLSVLIIIVAGCASPTPTPEPTATDACRRAHRAWRKALECVQSARGGTGSRR